MLNGFRLGDDDDDDEWPDPPSPRPVEKVAVAVVIAGLSAFVVKLAEWGVEKIRERFAAEEEDES